MRGSRGLKDFVGNESGQSLVEYSLLLVLVVLGAIVSLHSIGLWVSHLWTALVDIAQSHNW